MAFKAVVYLFLTLTGKISCSSVKTDKSSELLPSFSMPRVQLYRFVACVDSRRAPDQPSRGRRSTFLNHLHDFLGEKVAIVIHRVA
jgi:hypothetical protein